MRDKQEIFKDFEALGYKVEDENHELTLTNKVDNKQTFKITINKVIKEYEKFRIFKGFAGEYISYWGITIQEHKLLNELFTIWENLNLYMVHDEYYHYRVVVYANNREEAVEKLYKWMEETKQNGEFWNSKDVRWYVDLCDNNIVL